MFDYGFRRRAWAVHVVHTPYDGDELFRDQTQIDFDQLVC
jgi:hypothetical protein